jgi:hypothetical protein
VDGIRLESALLALLAAGLRAAPCTRPLEDYQGYRVRQVLVTSPIGFFSAGSYGFSQIAESLPLRGGAPFNIEQYNLGPSRITAALRAGFGESAAVRIIAAAGSLENCDDGAGTMDVRYIVYSAIVPPLAGRSFEIRQEASERPATAGASLGSEGRLLVMPLFGFNQTRGEYGGFRVRAQALELNAAASADSFTGTVGWVQGPWRATAAYRDVAAGGGKLVQSTVSGGYFGTWKLFRYGASLVGGSEGAGFKALAGAAGNGGGGEWSASYGLELGSTLSGRDVDFAKHIVDLAYTASFVPMPRTLDARPRYIGTPHHPVTLEARLGGGVIQDFGAVPLAERFFGGNQKLPFIEGGPWDVRGQPYIRSIPENRLGWPGGTRFYALNLTLAKPVYARSLLPLELGTREFTESLDSAIRTARGELSDSYLAKDPLLQAAGATIPAIQDSLEAIKRELEPLPPGLAPAAVSSDLGRAARTVASIRDGRALTRMLAAKLLPRLEADLAGLEVTLTAADREAVAARIGELRRRLAAARQSISQRLAGPAFEAARKRADQRAAHDFSTVDQVLHTVLYELNIYSIAPVAIFDAARVWPAGTGTQYAAGTGVRLSLVNVNFTLGYAFNPRPGAGQAKGAMFLQLDVADLFH